LAELELFNTLSGRLEGLAPADGAALRMYCCGPTVYDYGHIGNFRTFLHVDVLRRFLKQQGVRVEHAMNVTDVDDKIIRNAMAAGKGSLVAGAMNAIMAFGTRFSPRGMAAEIAYKVLKP